LSEESSLAVKSGRQNHPLGLCTLMSAFAAKADIIEIEIYYYAWHSKK